jgi:hypothetical protein
MYRVEARILAQRQQALPSIVRQQAPDDLPTRSAWELVHRRENLVALIHEANMVPSAGEAPGSGGILAPLRKFLAGLNGNSGAPVDPMDVLVRLIDKSLEVTTAEGTITIAIEWDDPQQAYRLVEGALQNFLEVRHLQEITAIDEVISMLQGRAATLRDQLERVIEEVRRQGARDTSRPLHMAESLGPPSEEAVRLKSMLEAKERAIADVEEFRRRRLADLQTQLDAQRAVYSEAHPTIKSLRQDIAALSRESPQISSLREEAEKLRREYGSSLAREGRPGSVAMPPLLRQPTGGPLEENERVRAARFQFQQMAERVSAAQVELDAARSAFKYRYHVVWPPEVPRKPVSPKPGKIFGVGVIASILFALAAAAAPEILSGRVVERWQVERSLDLPVLGEVSEK